jgi:RimJ/RimL family protein N-acetyltransferase
MKLDGDGIVLRSWREADAQTVYEACQDPEILRWLPLIPRPYTLEHARAFVSRPDSPYAFAIEADGVVAGSIAVRIDAANATGDLGYWCAPAARGRGVVTRALQRLCRFAFEELDLGRLELITDPDNTASQRVAAKVGFQREGVLRSHLLHPDGRRRDSVMFSLLPGELVGP